MKKLINYYRGGVYLERTESGSKPFLVLSADWLNRTSNVLLGVSLTLNKRNQYCVAVYENADTITYAVCNTLRPVDKSLLHTFLCTVEQEKMLDVEHCVQKVLAFNGEDAKYPSVRGELAIVNFLSKRGSGQRGVRPAVIVSADSINGDETVGSYLVVPLTTNLKKARLATHIRLTPQRDSCDADSLALCEQIGSVPKNKCRVTGKRVASISRIDAAIKIALDF